MEEDFRDEAERVVKRYLNETESTLRGKGMKVSSIWLHGSPTQAILQYTELNSVDLIAMSTRGYSGITRWAFGSVTSKIIETSLKPLLLIRPSNKT